MSKPDFKAWVEIASGRDIAGIAVVRTEELLNALEIAYDAGKSDGIREGLERAAEIADAMLGATTAPLVAAAIRAEKEKVR